MRASINRQPYDNCKMLSPDGDFMSYCAQHRFNWYLKNGLCEVIENDPVVFRLKFRPNGVGGRGEPYYEQALLNRCVACGATEELTKHHVVPSNYRRFFPDKYKRYMHHDILVMCLACHKEYEPVAYSIKETIAAENDVSMNGHFLNEDADVLIRARAIKASYALTRHITKIPKYRITQLEGDVAAFVGRKPTLEDLWELRRTPTKTYRDKDWKTHSEIIVGEMCNDDIEPFVLRWREHFLKFVLGKSNGIYMPDHWSVNYPVWRERNDREN